MIAAGKLARELLDLAGTLIRPGISTAQLDTILSNYTWQHGGISAPLGYKGFPRSICTSVNDVMCHGIPSEDVILREGDIINVDVTPIVNGWHGDASRTFPVGVISDEAAKLIRYAEECLHLGIKAVKIGGHVGDVGAAISSHARKGGFSVSPDFTGHGTGKIFHCFPFIPGIGKKGTGPIFKPGMTFTIEPILNVGNSNYIISLDGWTIRTADGRLSAQFEHTLHILPSGEVLILT